MNDQINLTGGELMRALQEAAPDDWDPFHVDPAGKAAAVIS